MGNTVGNSSVRFCNFYTSPDRAYLLGLWCADGYHRTSSIGLSNSDPDLIKRFADFLEGLFEPKRLKLRIYQSSHTKDSFRRFGIASISVLNSSKAKQVSYHVYVNSRPLLREFQKAKNAKKTFESAESGWAYIAGRFDGDGSVGKDMRKDLRISYGDENDARRDLDVLTELGIKEAKIYWYRTSQAYVIYVSRKRSEEFIKRCLPFSIKLQKRTLDKPVETHQHWADGWRHRINTP